MKNAQERGQQAWPETGQVGRQQYRREERQERKTARRQDVHQHEAGRQRHDEQEQREQIAQCERRRAVTPGAAGKLGLHIQDEVGIATPGVRRRGRDVA
jgi:hypothetical protein